MALRFRGSVLRLAENYRVTCAGDSVPRRRRAPPNPCRRCGAWWGPSSGRNRHPHMALRFRGSVLRPTENHRVTCAGKTIAHSATPFVECDPATERVNRGSTLRSRWRMVGPVVRPKPASPHGTPLPGKRATADGESPCHMRRWKRSAPGDACRRMRPDSQGIESGGTGFRSPQAVAHGGARPPAEAGIPTCRSASGEACYGRRKITVSMRRRKHRALSDANRRARRGVAGFRS